MYSRIISNARLSIFLFKRIKILQIQSYGQKQKSSKKPKQLKTVRSPEFRRYQLIRKNPIQVWQQQDEQCHTQSKSGKEVRITE